MSPGAGPDIVVVTGPAGAGRSTAIRALEDFGFEAIDNLPLSLMPRLIAGPPMARPLVVGVDARTREFDVAALAGMLDEIGARPGCRPVLVFIDCAASVLIARYNETRRRHPSSPHESAHVGIEREAAQLAPLKARADVLIDTSAMTVHDLKAELARWFAPADAGAGLAVTLQSFAYPRGLPRGADMVMDCRFLRNPHWDPALRGQDGRDPAVAAYVAADPAWPAFYARLVDMLRFLLPAYGAEGKSYFGVALGCTGGKHRSVAVTEALAKTLAQDGWQVSIHHRDLERTADTALVQRASGA
ncbi:RNase adapter RapZ [Amaricoccus sp.]|uniref:RNase adapter RapZ n=1 Tax=Amaricoccus sp. TaxID=1872485 RepID=UPI001B403414|nr:RNase adapter RapZ [Amaricoccus sp.]MBP7243042.1 RNase adapter RapZ [Amaricoccus sp.]